MDRWVDRKDLNQFDPQVASNGSGCPAQRLECHGRVTGIEQPVQGRAARPHATRQFYPLHPLLHLPCNSFFERNSLGFFQDPLFLQEVIGSTLDMRILPLHAVTSAFRS
jgi:hypothetical protein